MESKPLSIDPMGDLVLGLRLSSAAHCSEAAEAIECMYRLLAGAWKADAMTAARLMPGLSAVLHKYRQREYT